MFYIYILSHAVSPSNGSNDLTDILKHLTVITGVPGCFYTNCCDPAVKKKPDCWLLSAYKINSLCPYFYVDQKI